MYTVVGNTKPKARAARLRRDPAESEARKIFLGFTLSLIDFS